MTRFNDSGGWIAKAVGAACMLIACAAHAQLGVPAEGAEQPWSLRALFVERQGPSGLWTPWTILPLASPSAREPSPKGGPEFAVWSQGPWRRVEIWCGPSSLAWERLAPGASAQLEFDCLGARYRAQAGIASAHALTPSKPSPAASAASAASPSSAASSAASSPQAGAVQGDSHE